MDPDLGPGLFKFWTHPKNSTWTLEQDPVEPAP